MAAMAATEIQDVHTLFCPECGEQAGVVAYAAAPAEGERETGFATGPVVALLTSLPEGHCGVCDATLYFDEAGVIAAILTTRDDEDRAAHERWADALAEDVAAGERVRRRGHPEPYRSRWRNS